MKKLLKSSALSLIIVTSAFSGSFTIPEDSLLVPSRVARGAIVNFEEGKFSTEIDGATYQVKSSDVSGLPGNLTEDQLKGFLGQGYLSLKRIGDDYGIEGIVKGLGGVIGEGVGGRDGKDVGRDIGNIVGGGVGALVGAEIGGMVGGPAGVVVGGAIGAAVAMGGGELGAAEPPSAPVPSNAPSDSSSAPDCDHSSGQDYVSTGTADQGSRDSHDSSGGGSSGGDSGNCVVS
jgi:hypothetical protein